MSLDTPEPARVHDTVESLAAEIDEKATIPPSEPGPVPQAPEPAHRCPRCLHDLDQSILGPDPVDVQEYVRCILNKRRFRKTYSLFNGEISLSFQLLTQQESQQMYPLLRKIKHTDTLEGATAAYRLKLLFYLRQMNDSLFDIGACDDWEDEFAKRFSEYGEDVPVMLTRVLIEFLRLSERLPTEGLDANFWKGAGLS